MGAQTLAGTAVSLLAGVLVALWTPGDFQQAARIVAAVLGCLALFSCWRVPAIVALAGFLYAQAVTARVIEAPYDCDERRLVVAQVASIPAVTEEGWQFDVWLRPSGEEYGRRLRARLVSPRGVAPRAGERWQLLVQFSAPDLHDHAGRRNLLRDRISAQARVRASALNRRLDSAPWSIDLLRERVAARIASRIEDPSASSLLSALAVGVTGQVSRGQWRVFSATGITHLVAISGMHVTFFAMLCMRLARMAWNAWPRAMCLRRESFAAAVGVAMAFAYALLSGFEVPAQRTAVMLAAFLVARCLGRAAVPSWSLSVSLVAVLLFDPLSALSAGFWLSFVAVATIVLLAGGRIHLPGIVGGAAHVQWLVTVALMPLTVVLFGTFSAIGPLVNAMAIPLFSFALVPPLLIATAISLLPIQTLHPAADLLIDATGWLATAGWPFLAAAADWRAASILAEPGIWWLCLAPLAALSLLLPLPRPVRVAAAALLCAMFLARTGRPANGELEVLVVDVGPSRAVLLRTAAHQILVGTGETFGSQGRRFDARVLPELLRGGFRHVDLLLLDRPGRDALQAVARADAGLQLQEVMMDHRVLPPAIAACEDRRWFWDGVEFDLRRGPGCWLTARAAGRTVRIAPERSATAAPEGHVDVLVLPRVAREGFALLRDAGAGSAVIASLSRLEWAAGSWRPIREHQGATVLSTAADGSLRLRLGPRGVKAKALSRGPPGIWSATRPAQCRVPGAVVGL